MRDRRALGLKRDNIDEICENMCAASADSEDFLLPTDASAAIAWPQLRWISRDLTGCHLPSHHNLAGPYVPVAGVLLSVTFVHRNPTPNLDTRVYSIRDTHTQQRKRLFLKDWLFVKGKKKKRKKKEPFPLIKVFLFLQIVRPSLGKNWTCPWDCSPRTWSGAHQSGYGWRGGRLCGFNLAVCIRVYMRRLWGLSVFLSQQVRGDVPRLGLCLLPVTVVLLPIGGFRRAAAPLVLPPEAPQFGVPVFPPLEGQGGAVRHQATLLRAPAPFPLLCTDQEEGPPNVEGWAATAEVTVWDPEGVGAPAHTGSGPRTEDGLDWDGELPPRTWTLHPSHLHLQHWETQRCNINSSCFFFFINYFIFIINILFFLIFRVWFGFIHQIYTSLSFNNILSL